MTDTGLQFLSLNIDWCDMKINCFPLLSAYTIRLCVEINFTVSSNCNFLTGPPKPAQQHPRGNWHVQAKFHVLIRAESWRGRGLLLRRPFFPHIYVLVCGEGGNFPAPATTVGTFSRLLAHGGNNPYELKLSGLFSLGVCREETQASRTPYASFIVVRHLISRENSL